MTEAERLTAAIDAAAGTLPDAMLGFLVRPSAIVAHMIVALADRTKTTLDDQIVEHGGIEGLAAAAGLVEEWIDRQTAYRRLAASTGPVRAELPPLFKEFTLHGGGIRLGYMPDQKTILHLSAEIEGAHIDRPTPTDAWRRRMADALAELLPPEARPGFDDLEGDAATNRVLVRSSHPLFAERWWVSGLGVPEHMPAAFIEADALRIATAIAAVHGLDGFGATHVAPIVEWGERRLEADLRQALGPVDGAVVRVGSTKITVAYLQSEWGHLAAGRDRAQRLALSHFNATSTVTIPGHDLKPETFETGCNVVRGLEYHDVRRHEMRLRERGDAIRAGGMTMSPVLARLAKRDGVDRDALIGMIDGSTGNVSKADMRRLGFAKDVAKIVAKNGRIDCHLDLAKGAAYRAGKVHVLRTALPDVVREALQDGPLARLVDHPMLKGATITRTTCARTGSLIVDIKLH